jgi:glycerophosphoryl diester phosphodiesterase
MEQNTPAFPKIIGHRGCVMALPAPYQNTLKAFKKSLTLADGFEADIVKSANGTLYMMHPTRMMGSKIISDLKHHLDTKIDDASFFEDLLDTDIEELRLKDASHIPTFEETLDLFMQHILDKPNALFNIELKSPDVAAAVCGILNPLLKLGKIYPHNFIISSFEHSQLSTIQKELPFVPRGLLFAHKEHDGTAHYKALTASYLKNAAHLEASYGILPTGALDKAAINALKKHSLDLIVWTESEKADPKLEQHLELALHSGILKAIIADNPREVSCLINTLISSL